jgi:hypothetical protein
MRTSAASVVGLFWTTMPQWQLKQAGMRSRSGLTAWDMRVFCVLQVRHDRRVGAASAVRFLTDGVLMRQLQADFLLRTYSIILLDEAHERSLNTDLLLGKQWLLQLFEGSKELFEGSKEHEDRFRKVARSAEICSRLSDVHLEGIRPQIFGTEPSADPSNRNQLSNCYLGLQACCRGWCLSGASCTSSGKQQAARQPRPAAAAAWTVPSIP